MKLRRRMGDRGALRIFDSVLRMACWWRNTKALHLVKQRGALQAKSGSCSWTSELPISALASSQNFSTYLVFEGWVEISTLVHGCPPTRRRVSEPVPPVRKKF